MKINSLTELRPESLKFKIILLCALALLLFLRRPMEFLDPYVWNEDAIWNMPAYLESGIFSLFHPVQGYLILPSKIINAISLKISFLYYPEISMYLSALFSIFCLFFIAYAPTLLRYKVACALAVIFIPSDPEVFVLPLYSFWWGTLFVFLALLWNTEGKSNKLRIFSILIGGLSSPIIILLAPLFALRAAIYRNRIEIITLFIAIVLASIQSYFVFTKASMTNINLVEILQSSIIILTKFIGQYFYYGIPAPINTIISLLFVLFLIWCWVNKRKELDFSFYLLIGLYILAILASVKRVPVEIIDPYHAGPRYFFYPFVILSWILIFLYSFFKDQKKIRYIFWFIFLCVILNSATKFYRLSESPDWRNEIAQCVNNKKHYIPINFDGKLQNLWHMQLDSSQCEQLMKQSIFDNPDKIKFSISEKMDYLYSDFHAEDLVLLNKMHSIGGTWTSDELETTSDSQKIIKLSSWVGNDAFIGSQKLTTYVTNDKIRIAYQTGPVSVNQKIIITDMNTQHDVLSISLKKSEIQSILEVDASKNTTYEIKLIDMGKNWGEWSSILIPE